MYGQVSVVTEVRVTHSKNESALSSMAPISEPERARRNDNQTGDEWPDASSLYNRPLPPAPPPPPPGLSTIVTSRQQRALSTAPKDNITAQTQRSIRRAADRFKIHDPVKRAYLRTSFLFAVSVLVTWIPSSINRIRGMFYSDSPYAYNVGTATVLPLQGVWNAVIFFVMSWKILRESIADWSNRGQVVELTEGGSGRDRFGGGAAPVWRDTSREEDTGLGRRPHTKAEKDGYGKDSWDFADVGREGSDIELRGSPGGSV
jgi:hypothetical protein